MSIVAPALLVGLLLCPGSATTTTPTAGDDGAPVAIVDGRKLTRGAFKEFLLGLYGPSTLDTFINEEILLATGKKDGIEVGEKEAADWIEERVKEAAGSPDYQQLDPNELRKQYRPHAKTGCLLERLVKRRRLTEEGVKREYELRYGEKRRARHILIRAGGDGPVGPTPPKPEEVAAAKKKADDLYEQLKKGADFVQLAKKESQDPGSAENGGEIPEFNRLEVVPEFAGVAFKLKENEYSEPVKSDFGYHIIQVTKIVPAAKPLDEKLLSELRSEVGKRPVDREEVQRLLTEIRKGAKVEKLLE